LLLLSTVAAAALAAQEVQQHGLVFEQWVRDTFFDGYRPDSYTQKWDIPAAANTRHGGIPVNPKAVKYGSSVDLGDALRQYQIDEPFLLVIGFWRQEGTTKRFVNIVAAHVEPGIWRRMWDPVTLPDLERLDAAIKDRSLTPAQARSAAAKMKSTRPFTQSRILVNPKIDSGTQRRLQCSIRFDDLFRHLAPGADRTIQERPALWGVEFPHPLSSPPRAFTR
jgi:hypothetical protein